MDDFVVVSSAWLLNQQVTTYDDAGNDGQYQRHGAEIVYVFAEFMQAKGLSKDNVDVSRRADMELRFSQLTDQGRNLLASRCISGCGHWIGPDPTSRSTRLDSNVAGQNSRFRRLGQGTGFGSVCMA